MNLRDLLTELRENILHDRSDRAAGTPDYLWSDGTLVRYINEAQRRFARHALCIRDSATAEVCQVALVTGQINYTLHPSILSVTSAKVAGDNVDMARVGHSALDARPRIDDSFWDQAAISTTASGKPQAFTTDETAGLDDYDTSGLISMRVYPAPSAAYNGVLINMRVIRLPINPLNEKQLNAVPEIPEDHHLEMLDYAAYLALRIVDTDAGNPARAAEFKAIFEDNVKRARNSVVRKMHVPQGWGFGRGGFSGWEK